MNLGKVNCQELAYNVCSILGNWRLVGEPEQWYASIARADGLHLSITEAKTSSKKPMVSVSFDFHHSVAGLNREYVMRADNHSINCVADPSSVASAIRTRLLPDAEQTYFTLKAECEAAERRLQERKRVLTDFANAIGEKIKGRDESILQGNGIVYYKRGARFQLDVQYTGYENCFHLDGYCNYIPVDLMYRLIPVIEAWHAEKKEATQ